MSYPVEALEARVGAETGRAVRAEARVAEIEGSRWFRLGQQLHPLRWWLRR